MDAQALRHLQAPLKARYREDAAAAHVVCRARGTLTGDALTCRVDTPAGPVTAGLHEATGGDGSAACSGDMLLSALVACAGVTLRAVATAMGLSIRGGTVSAEADWDVRGTLGVSREAPVGFTAIRLHFDLETDANEESLRKLVELTERYCVVYQTLVNKPDVSVSHATA